VLNIPLVNSFAEYPFSSVNDFIEEMAVSHGAIYVDLLPTFSGYDADALRVSFMDGHMNELGHAITAEVLFQTLLKGRIVKGCID